MFEYTNKELNKNEITLNLRIRKKGHVSYFQVFPSSL